MEKYDLTWEEAQKWLSDGYIVELEPYGNAKPCRIVAFKGKWGYERSDGKTFIVSSVFQRSFRKVGKSNRFTDEDNTKTVVTKLKAVKNDADKPDMSLIPKVALEECAKAFMVGEKKYSRYNYLEGSLTATQIASAAIRHLYAWLDGEENCQVDKQHHLGSVLACASMILDLQAKNKLNDNRYNKGE